MILSIQTSTFGARGGIPTYNRLVCRALNTFVDADNSVLILTDRNQDIIKTSHEFPNLHLRSFGGSRAAFVHQALASALRQEIDIALIGHVNYAPLGLLMRKLQPSLRYGVFLYGIDAWARLSPLRLRALRKADFTVSISEYTRQRAIEINEIESSRAHLLPNALECSVAPRGKESEAPDSGKTLLTVCRLDSTEKYKGVDTVIKALPAVIARVPDAQYVIVGEGSDTLRLKRIASEAGVLDRVQFVGSVSDQELQTYYCNCDVFVMPSAKEGFGFVFLEAMEYAKPVIAANCGGAPEVVIDDENGLLVDYGDVPQLAEKLIRLCTDNKMRRRLGDAGYERLHRYSFKQFRSSLTDILLRELPTRTLYRRCASINTASCYSAQ